MSRIAARRARESEAGSYTSSFRRCVSTVDQTTFGCTRTASPALALEGYKVSAVNDGEAALHAIASDPPDLIVLDLMMPRVDGLTVCRRLRTRGDRTPILIMTARTEVSDRVSGLDAGADDYLPK